MKIWQLSILLLLGMNVAAVKKHADRGPFRAVLVSVTPCRNSTYPLKKDPSILAHMSVDSSTNSRSKLLNGNITVVRDTRHVRLKLKSFAWADGSWKLTTMLNDISCHGLALNMLCRAISFKMLDTTKCAFLKGIYLFKGLDINKMQHNMFSTNMVYGQTLWQSEINIGFTTHQCWELHTKVEPV